MCAYRRDFVVDKAKTTISRKNQVRSQAILEIQNIKKKLKLLQKVITLLLNFQALQNSLFFRFSLRHF